MIKKSSISIILFLFFQISYSQKKGVENLMFNFQTGTFGIWVNNETRIFNNIALRSEIGLDAGILGGEINGNTGIFLTPVITVEPRWYYNITAREKRNKTTKNNSANFFTTAVSYHPDWFIISKKNNVLIYNQLSFIPKWGIRRTIANSNFNYEAGIGIGYRFYFLKQYDYSTNNKEMALDVHLRIGYTFKKMKK